MSANVVKAATVSKVRTCTNCPKQFVPPTAAPKAEMCRACHQAAKRHEAERQRALAAVAQREKAAKETSTLLREWFEKDQLPKSAKVIRSGRQVTVAWQGMSATFHVSA